MTRRRLGWLAMAVVLAVFLAVGLSDDGGPRTPDERAQHLAESLMCPTCRGQSVADSDSAASRGIRSLIDDRIDAGATDDEIRDELVGSWGEGIVLTPERSGIMGLVWVLPVVALVAAAVGIGLAFRRWRGQRADSASDADRAAVEQALAGRR